MTSEDREMCSDEVLDLFAFIFDKDYSKHLIRNLIALVLNGVLGGQSRPLTDPRSMRVRELAHSMYDDLCQVLPTLTSVKDDLAMEMAVEIRVAIRTHFGRMPELIVSKMKKIGRAPSTIPEQDAEQDDIELPEDTDEEQDDTESGEDDNKLPSECQPVFCPTAGFSDTFKLSSETAVIALLWGTGNTPTRRIMDTVCKRKEAQEMADDKYGKLFHWLFIGDRDKIAGNPGKVQTSYGKRTTTTEQTSKRASHTFFKLKLHVTKWFEYLA
ncbi:hypothetical protein BGZ99_003026 [Dissophora globulifera]|uniref:Uncharacterized protein n=1 Tax=Dissophora globulifera TaxID=979702 RepID=A0A9P6RWH4_9FUNG|nr:hypothetical protein BGZ99_003026 [Dissophora globulifera]